MSQRIAPSTVIEGKIAEVLAEGITDSRRLSAVGRLGAQLVLQRALEWEVAAFLGRARYERTAEGHGYRNGHRPRRIQTAEGEVTVAVPQVRGSAEAFVSSVIPHTRGIVRTRPLEALIIGAYVRGLSDRDIESLVEEAGLGPVSRTAASEIARELHGRYRAFCERDLGHLPLVALFLDAVYLRTRPSGPKEGVLVAWGYREDGRRELIAVRLGQRESYTDWLDLGRDLMRRRLPEPLLVVSDGAPGLTRAVSELWPRADRQRCTVHRLRNLLAKLPLRSKDAREHVQVTYWKVLDEAGTAGEAEEGLRRLAAELARHYPTAARCLLEDVEALCSHLRYPASSAGGCARRTCWSARSKRSRGASR